MVGRERVRHHPRRPPNERVISLCAYEKNKKGSFIMRYEYPEDILADGLILIGIICIIIGLIGLL